MSFRSTLAKCGPLKTTYHMIRSGAMTTACRVSPALLMGCRYRIAWGRWPSRRQPESFDEKLQWLNLYWQHPLKSRCGDKFAMRGYVEEHGLGRLLTKLFGAYSSTQEIFINTLPDRFVLKCSHGCKCNIFCTDKATFDWPAAKVDLDLWMQSDTSLKLGELHYGRMTRRIICEEFLQDSTGHDLPADYKVFCFRGTPHCTMVATARAPNGTARLAFYGLEWKHKLPYCIPDLAADVDIPRPAAYEDMLACAQLLSRPFPFARMDFYSIDGRAKLGEMTFTPGACVSGDYMTDVAQRELGRLIELPEPRFWPPETHGNSGGELIS